MAPLIGEAANRPDLQHQLFVTGQQGSLLEQAARECGLSIALSLGPFSGAKDMESQLTGMETALSRALESSRPDLVLVHGDTNSALAGARTANRLGVPVGHVEAGLRTHIADRPWPEEHNRCQIAQLATLHFAPSEQAAGNLIAERVSGTIFVTGNTGIDVLLANRPRSAHKHGRKVFVTCHRRENFGAPLDRICDALLTLADEDDTTFTLPLHPNPNVRDRLVKRLHAHRTIQLVAPLPYRQLLRAVTASTFVITDSGGLQEECAALGVPLLLMREETERPEVVASGNCILVGSDTNSILCEARRLLDDPEHRNSMSMPAWPYGKGKAAIKILDAIEAWMGQQRAAPTLSITQKM
jgi:UDP-N-acetylglucosamine 2-epimerase (non-hydrolysing)